ncbi:ADP-heptose:LPS heptosyltransferase [Micromonospora pattaloongensis]|uniref:ADP-heptose:LPS heptosyltransferase n=1 Tax=Micromonospora pattaloongensis TaxID=405436 RepID=A0A1H3S7V1_9ACTN|nr:glycosyltransferase family 9 protein [Micromonospora pattaloongensis]SDZ33678.1 ADP-heptose:LPS heptosyltransferase [Micromonospora pattaloongensis]
MILVLRALGIGDLATAVPALRGLRRAFPDRTLALAAPQWLAPLVELVGGIDRLVPVAGLAPYRWPVPPPYWAVNLHGRGPQSHRLLRAAAPRLLRAFRCREAGHLDGPRWIGDEHETRRWCRLLSWYGVASDPGDLALRRPPPGPLPSGVTVLHPGCKEPQRRWPPARFAALARRLVADGHRVVVSGSAADRPLAAGVAALAGLPPTAVLAGRTPIAELADLISRARLLISADTGVGHLATAYRTPSVLLFGPTSPARWGPPVVHRWHRVLWCENLGSMRCESGTHPALAAIGVDAVLAAAQQVDVAATPRLQAVSDATAAQ